jgi:hypothetical protein
MNREHIETAIEALEFQYSNYQAMLEREPKTRNRQDNPMRSHLLQRMDKLTEAQAALAAMLPPVEEPEDSFRDDHHGWRAPKG